MAKLGDYKTPTGASGNILNPMDWLSLIMGAFVLIIAFAMGQNLANKAGSKLPVDTTIDPITTSKLVIDQPKNQNARVIL
jgi:hypothetical protein